MNIYALLPTSREDIIRADDILAPLLPEHSARQYHTFCVPTLHKGTVLSLFLTFGNVGFLKITCL